MRSFLENAFQRKQFAPLAPDYVDALVLVANTPQTYTLPAGAKYVIFACSAGNFYVNWGGTNAAATAAAVPGSNVVNGNASEVNPEAREIPDSVIKTGSISVIGDSAAVLTIACYRGG